MRDQVFGYVRLEESAAQIAPSSLAIQAAPDLHLDTYVLGGPWSLDGLFFQIPVV